MHLACAPHLFDLISAIGSYSLAKFAMNLLCAFRLPFGPVGGAGTKILRRFLPLSAGAEASPGVYAPAVIVYTVEGEQIDPAVLRDGSWQHPKRPADPLDLQKHFGRKKTDPTEPPADLGRTGASAASKSKSRPPQLPRRKPMPRLPEEHYKILLRPKCLVNLTNIGLVALLEAIYTTSKVDQAQAEQVEQVRVHPIKNTITISTPDKARANAYRALGLLRSEEYSIDMPVSAYVPAPDDSIRGLVYKAYTNETDHDINKEISRKNPQLPIVSARRLGNSRHFVITLAGKDLPSSIRYCCFNLKVYPFKDRPEACFNCRKLGHRTDVCPQPRPPTPRCRRCGEQHSPPPEGEKPTCVPLCVVCHGCNTRRSRELDKTISGGHNSQHDEPAKNVAWGSGKPHHRESTVPQAAAPLEAPSEQKPRNARVLTHTREECSGFKTSQAVREEGSQARHQQSKPQQQQQDPQLRELAEQIKFPKQQLAAANDKIRQLEKQAMS
ncbi:hypothetical protein HPB50_023168 [Hyalomma asiaticum]|uniref:Uncharacterized protein n=1 Tax=Hyalomma asiaticum TaxID=266040 RepID=A0ACB7T9L4_HYAAI|nr:hypothetical protein HPB50_023168 [Hyalomma asiaticum]